MDTDGLSGTELLAQIVPKAPSPEWGGRQMKDRKWVCKAAGLGIGIALCMSVSAAETEEQVTDRGIRYTVYMPEDGKDQNRTYPVVYLMPSEGNKTKLYETGDIQKLVSDLEGKHEIIPMVIVAPEFEEGSDYRKELEALVSHVEDQYPVIQDARYRGILGTDIGGYMALETSLISKSNLFFAAGSVMGDFTGETNPYLENGSVVDAANALDREAERGYSFLQNHYFYLEAPNGSADTTIAGGTTDIGASLEKKTNPYYQYGDMYALYSTPDTSMTEYAVLDGTEERAYAVEGIGRALNRFSRCFSDEMIQGSFEASPQVVEEKDSQSIVSGSITLLEEAAVFTKNTEDMNVIVSMKDPESGEILHEDQKSLKEVKPGEKADFEITLPLDKKAEGTGTTIQLSVDYLGMRRVLGDKKLVAIQPDGTTEDTRQIDLMGNWYFRAYREYREGSGKETELDRIENILPAEYETWGIVQPCLGWWNAEFDASLNGQDNYAGYAWYVRTFEVPEDFPSGELTLAAGFFDEANEVYVNGKLVGSTGMDYSSGDGIGVYDGSNPWDTDCVYALDSSLLNYGQTNTIAIRMCNSTGGGGWYAGPVGIYTKDSYNRISGKSGETADRFFEASYTSETLGEEETYRIYLPKSYLQDGNEKSYPVLYLLHGINSQSKTFEIDHVDKYFDQAIEEGTMEEMIVVMPDDPTKESFWQGKYGDMVTKDLIPEIDRKYRTLSEKEFRYIGGCSMGGGGAMSIGFNNPELFSGIISFYGALEYTDAFTQAAALEEEILQGYRIYMTCGNQDMYNFYDSQEQMSRFLTEKGVSHYHEVNNGTHSSEYYLPRLIDAIGYMSRK